MSKLDKTKPKISYLYSSALYAMAKVREKAMEKYPGPEDWRTTNEKHHYDACFRHVFAALEGEWLDKESGLPHLAHAMCNLMFIIENRGPELTFEEATKFIDHELSKISPRPLKKGGKTC